MSGFRIFFLPKELSGFRVVLYKKFLLFVLYRKKTSPTWRTKILKTSRRRLPRQPKPWIDCKACSQGIDLCHTSLDQSLEKGTRILCKASGQCTYLSVGLCLCLFRRNVSRFVCFCNGSRIWRKATAIQSCERTG